MLFHIDVESGCNQRFRTELSNTAPGSPNNISDPITSVHVIYRNGLWSVAHIFASGRAYYRERQYVITDTSTDTTRSWRGTMRNRKYIEMDAIAGINNNQYIYKEVVHDLSIGGVQTGMTFSYCERVGGPPAPPSSVASSPQTAENTAYRACKDITEPAQRLACYDNAAGVNLPKFTPCPVASSTSTPAAPAPNPPAESHSPVTAMTPAAISALPTGQRSSEQDFIRAVKDARADYAAAQNEMQQGAARAKRIPISAPLSTISVRQTGLAKSSIYRPMVTVGAS